MHAAMQSLQQWAVRTQHQSLYLRCWLPLSEEVNSDEASMLINIWLLAPAL